MMSCEQRPPLQSLVMPPRTPIEGGPLTTTLPANWISLQARHGPNRSCFVDMTGRVHTFGEVNRRVNRLARAFLANGLQRFDRIGILATDSVDYMVVLMASLKIGTTYVPFNYRLADGEIEVLATAGDLDAFITTERYAWAVDVARTVCPRLRLVAGLDRFGDLPTIDDLIEDIADDSDLDVCTRAEDIVSIMFTSGTTGRPKGVMQSMRMMSAGTANAIIDFNLGRDEFRYTASPMFHAAGMGCVYYGLARGFCSLILDQYEPATLLHWMQHGLTGVLMMPTMLSSLLQLDGARDADYSSLRSIAYGGSPITPALLRDVLDVFDCDLYNTFGAGTEGAGQAMFFPADHARALAGETHLLGSIGHPMYGVELRLVDDEMNDVEPGEIGEICTRSDSVMSGYLGDPERTAQAVVDGWFRAGDMAYMDDEGYLYLASRKADMIIRGGENVYPVEIESVLADHASVRNVAVVGLPDDHWGEVVVAAVEPTDPAEFDEGALQEHCRTMLATYKVPARVVAVDELPKNATGKVQKHLVADLVMRLLA
jgi:acyl-CoA synthetase (AMP-forming)/AMP-acid ligase II